jgi:peroxiredoxin
MPTLPRALVVSLALTLVPPSARAASLLAPAGGDPPIGVSARGVPEPGAPVVRPAADAAGLAAEVGRGRPVVLHFWATWCAACEGEFGRLRALLNALPGRGVAVALVSIDAAETRARVPAELRRLGVSALPSMILEAPDPAPIAAALREPQWDGTLPATFVFDARGRKVAAFLGTTTRARLEKAVRAASRRADLGAANSSGAPPPPAQPKG